MAIIKGTLFSDVYENFLSKTTDDMYMELTEEDTFEILRQLLISAIPHFQFPRQNLKYQLIKTKEENQDGDVFTINWAFVNKLTTEEINILATYMVVQWIGQQLASVQNTRMKYSGSDFKFTSQANHIHKLLQLQKRYEQKGFHLQRLYKRRKVDKNGIYRSTFSTLMEAPIYTDTNSIAGDNFIEQITNNKSISLIKGDTFTFDLFFSDLENIDIINIFFSVKKEQHDLKYILQKSINNGITLIDTLKYRIQLSSEDTQNLNQGRYYYDLQVNLGNDIYTIMMGTFNLKEDITKL